MLAAMTSKGGMAARAIPIPVSHQKVSIDPTRRIFAHPPFALCSVTTKPRIRFRLYTTLFHREAGATEGAGLLWLVSKDRGCRGQADLIERAD